MTYYEFKNLKVGDQVIDFFGNIGTVSAIDRHQNIISSELEDKYSLQVELFAKKDRKLFEPEETKKGKKLGWTIPADAILPDKLLIEDSNQKIEYISTTIDPGIGLDKTALVVMDAEKQVTASMVTPKEVLGKVEELPGQESKVTLAEEKEEKHES